MLTLVFMGTPEFAVPILRRLAASSHRVLEVVSNPDRPAGRGRRLSPSPVSAVATELGLPLARPERFRSAEFIAHLGALAPDAVVVAAFGKILRRAHLDIPRLGCVNVHPSLLPRHRGATPIQHALLSGDDVTGVTTILMDEGIDSGDILLQRAIEVGAGEDAGSLHDRLAALGAEIIVETLDGLEAGSLHPLPQDDAAATHCRLLEKEDGRIDWTWDAVAIYRHVRAMTPWPGAHTVLRGEGLLIRRVAPVEVVSSAGRPGRMIGIDRDGAPVVACGRGTLRLLRVTPSGGREVSGADLVRGRRFAEGDVMGESNA